MNIEKTKQLNTMLKLIVAVCIFMIVLILLTGNSNALNSSFCEDRLNMNLSLVGDLNECNEFLGLINQTNTINTTIYIDNSSNIINQTTINNTIYYNSTRIENHTNVYNTYNVSGVDADELKAEILEDYNTTISNYLKQLEEENKIKNLEFNFSLKEIELKNKLEIMRLNSSIPRNTMITEEEKQESALISKLNILESQLKKQQSEEKEIIDETDEKVKRAEVKEQSNFSKLLDWLFSLEGIIITGIILFLANKLGYLEEIKKKMNAKNEDITRNERNKEYIEDGLKDEIKKVGGISGKQEKEKHNTL